MIDALAIGELAARSGVAPSALRFYEAQGLIAAQRTSGNQRRYERAMLRRTALIQAGRAAGIPLEQIRAALATLPADRTPTRHDWETLSRDWRDDLDRRISTLQALRDRLTTCIGCGCLSIDACGLLNPDDEASKIGPGAHYLERSSRRASGSDRPVLRRSRSTRSIHTYGGDASQVGELFLPKGSGLRPVAIVIHGGYWRARYDRELMTALCVDLAQHGWAAWNLEYRRVGGGGGWPETFVDIAAGVDALAELDAPLDLERVAAVGHSAGGQLAVWAAARSTLPAGSPGADPSVRIEAVVSQAGVVDLRLAAQLAPSDEPTRALLGDPETNAEVYALASPRERVPLGIPQLVLHGVDEDTVSRQIAESYTTAAREAGDPCELVLLQGTGHFEHIDPGSEAWRVAREWLDGYASAAFS